ncbi:38254_t:CDS:1, partial [Gigaspora margarita]
ATSKLKLGDKSRRPYDTKLKWINRKSFFNQGTQRAEVYAEASNNKKLKSAEENNFSRKKDKE